VDTAIPSEISAITVASNFGRGTAFDQIEHLGFDTRHSESKQIAVEQREFARRVERKPVQTTLFPG
jgi:hypothetical protein